MNSEIHNLAVAFKGKTVIKGDPNDTVKVEDLRRVVKAINELLEGLVSVLR